MTIAGTAPDSMQRMIPVFRIQHFAVSELSDDGFQLGDVLPSFSHPFDVPEKAGRLRERLHFAQLANISSRDSNDSTPCPLRLFVKVALVSAFGISTRNGRPLRRQI